MEGKHSLHEGKEEGRGREGRGDIERKRRKRWKNGRT